MSSYEMYAVLRDNKGYTDYRVCKLADIETATISSWKTGRYEPKVNMLKKIADVLECDVSDFYAEMDNEKGNIVIPISYIENLDNLFNKFVAELGNISIKQMKDIVEISEIIQKMMNGN